MTDFDGEYKKLIKESKNHLSDIIKKYNKASTTKAKVHRVLLTGRHFGRMAAKLWNLHDEMEE